MNSFQPRNNGANNDSSSNNQPFGTLDEAYQYFLQQDNDDMLDSLFTPDQSGPSHGVHNNDASMEHAALQTVQNQPSGSSDKAVMRSWLKNDQGIPSNFKVPSYEWYSRLEAAYLAQNNTATGLNDFPIDDLNIDYHIDMLKAAMIDCESITGDGKGDKQTRTAIGRVRAAEWGLIAWKLLMNMIAAHRGEPDIPSWSLSARRAAKNKNTDQYGTWEKRFQAVLKALTHNKNTVTSLLECSFSKRLAADPVGELKTKLTNKDLNLIRDIETKAGRPMVYDRVRAFRAQRLAGNPIVATGATSTQPALQITMGSGPPSALPQRQQPVSSQVNGVMRQGRHWQQSGQAGRKRSHEEATEKDSDDEELPEQQRQFKRASHSSNYQPSQVNGRQLPRTTHPRLVNAASTQQLPSQQRPSQQLPDWTVTQGIPGTNQPRPSAALPTPGQMRLQILRQQAGVRPWYE